MVLVYCANKGDNIGIGVQILVVTVAGWCGLHEMGLPLVDGL